MSRWMWYGTDLKFGESPYLHGLHEFGGEHLMLTNPGWIVDTLALGHDPNDHGGKDYLVPASQGYGIIARLNNGYYPAGTIPHPDRYGDFAQRCANFCAATPACRIFIIGNEPNHGQERPDGRPISAEDYFRCFLDCYNAIKRVRPDAEILPAPIAPWNTETGDWLVYFKSLMYWLSRRNLPEGLALHTYTHGNNADLVFKDDDIRHGWNWQFDVYKQMLDEIREYVSDIPIYITEACPVEPGWPDGPTTWYSNAVKNVSGWNSKHPSQLVRTVVAYRWPFLHDQPQWAIETRPHVQDDFVGIMVEGRRWLEPEPTPPPPPPPPPEEGDMQVVFSEGFEHGNFPPYEGQTHLLVPEGWDPDWIPGAKPGPVRPEIQPEDAERGDRGIHTGRYGIKLCHAYSFFDGVLHRQVQVAGGVRSQARGWTTAESGGGLGCRIGIDPTGGTDFRADTVQWSDWWGTDYPEFDSYVWRQLSTPVVDAGPEGLVTIFLRVVCRHAVQVNAGFWDDVELLAEGSPTPPPTPPPPTPPPGSRRWRVDLRITGTVEEVQNGSKSADE